MAIQHKVDVLQKVDGMEPANKLYWVPAGMHIGSKWRNSAAIGLLLTRR